MPGRRAPIVRVFSPFSDLRTSLVASVIVSIASLLLCQTAHAANGWSRRNFDPGGTSHYPVASIPNEGDLVPLWSVTNSIYHAVLTEDLDEDGVLDIVASDGASLTAYHGDGNTMWTVPATGTLSYIGDVDGDWDPEICVTNWGSELSVDVYEADGSFAKRVSRLDSGYDSRIHVLGNMGTDLIVGYSAGYSMTPRGCGVINYTTGAERCEFLTGGGGSWGCFGFGDPDGDGTMEIALPWGTPHNGNSVNGTTDGDLYGVLVEWNHVTGACASQFVKRNTDWYASTDPNGELSAMIADLGNGGEATYFLEAHQNYYPGTEHIYRVDPSGACLARWDGGDSDGWALTSTVVPDVNGDGVREIAVSPWLGNQRISVIDGASLATLYVQVGGGAILGSVDFDGDGGEELIVYHEASYQLRVLDVATLAIEESLYVGSRFHMPYYDNTNRFAISDVTGDGTLELIAGLSTGLTVIGLHPVGACCGPDGACALTIPEDCVAPNAYQGDGTDCSPNPCPQYPGACCHLDGSCTIRLAFECHSPDVFLGVGTTCDPNPCLQPGACCYPDGLCMVRLPDECIPPSVFLGDGVTCDPDPCPHPLAGSIRAWGAGTPVPAPNKDFIAVSAGGGHGLGLKTDGTVVAWGRNDKGQCNVPGQYTDVIAVAGGWAHSLCLRSNGSIVAWGDNSGGQCNIPSPNGGFVAISAGGYVSLGLRSNGEIESWGAAGDPPYPNTNFIAVAAGWSFAMGLKSDGSIVAWGDNSAGQCIVPSPNADFARIAAGGLHGIGLKADGTIVAWGDNNYGQCNAPTSSEGFTGIAAGTWHSLALRADGRVQGWGDDDYGEASGSFLNGGVVAVSAGFGHSLGLLDHLTGACCNVDGTCDLTRSEYCLLPGTYQGDGTVCEPNLCTQPLGACCLTDGSCQLSVAAECTPPNVFMGAHASCDPNPCPQPGACCFQDGHCTTRVTSVCAAEGGTFTGEGVPCTPSPCSGACCFADGHCSALPVAECSAQGGWFVGFGNPCDPNPCSGNLGACCFGDGRCELRPEGDCATTGGLFRGLGSACLPNPCPQPQACCDAEGFCTMLAPPQCTLSGKTPVLGQDCDPPPCANSDASDAVTTSFRPFVSPNPARSSCNVAYWMPEEGPVDVRVYDVAGRLVRALVSQHMARGAHTETWDGRDDGGNPLPAGVYIARIRLAGSLSKVHVILIP